LVDRKRKKAKKSKKINEATEETKTSTPETSEVVEDGLKKPKKEKKAKKRKSETGEETQPAKDKEAKKEKKAKFTISLNTDDCVPPIDLEPPTKAKKPFWRPNKGPKVIIANGEKDETLAKQKKREKDKKRKKKKTAEGEEPQIHETPGHSKALRYLTTWAEDRQNWKFEKCRQIWLLQNCYDPLKVPDKNFPSLVEYINSIRGKMREMALVRAKEVMEKEEAYQAKIEAGKTEEELKDQKIPPTEVNRATKIVETLSEETETS